MILNEEEKKEGGKGGMKRKRKEGRKPIGSTIGHCSGLEMWGQDL